ncbi:HNH endonuclease signature motif containing protein [Gordonia malaquae]|uniref:HNH endonuclease signature motif containing protein n=1 Tax=Gordonia malaquae TaxID=410332 RepID=UPI0030FE39EC
MFTSIVGELTDRIVDELAPPTATETDSGESPRLACLLASASKVGADDAEILSAIVEVARARNVLDAAQAQLVRTAERAGIPFRKHLRSAKMLLTEIGVPPAVADRTVRNGHHAERFTNVGRGMRDGSMSAEIADAIGAGVARVAARVPLAPGEPQRLARKLALNTTPAEVKAVAKQEAIALAAESDDPDLVPASENPELNEMSLYLNDEGRVEATMDLDVVTGEELNAALDPLCKPVPEPDGSPDPRSARQRRADALGQIIRTYLSGSDRPTSGGVLPHASIVIPASGVPGDGVARLGFTGPVSPATVALSLCTSAVTRITVDGEGVPLDVGREQRLMTPGIRKALAARDCGCAFPGCGRPVTWTDAHHCTPWSEGGATSLGNGVLLCRMHHTLIHQSGWEVFIGHDGHPWFLEPADPARPDRPRVPIRSHARRSMTSHADAAA